MIGRYVWRDLRRNPRRSLTALAGMTLGIGLFSAVLFFIDGSSATMTARAIAPIPIDMQRVLADPLGNKVRLTQQIDPSRLQPGQRGHVTLVLANNSSHPANEVVIRDEPIPPLSYVPNSMTIDGSRMPDYGGEFPLSQGEANLGLNLGTVRPKSKVTLAYDVVADSAVESVPSLGPSASFSSREIGVPVKANTSEPRSLDELTRQIGQIPGVARAEPLSFVDLDPGSLSAGAKRLPEATRVFGLDNRYLEQDPSIRIVEGSYEPGSGLLSAEAARALSIGPGGVVQIRVPGMSQPLSVLISGITDVSRAKSLFYSREGKRLEQFVYVRNSVIVAPEVFPKTIIPAFQNVATAPGTVLRSQPILEVDVFMEREPLDADPGTALAQTKAVADGVNAVALGQDVLIDNISNALQVARDDARTAKRMFVFLGLPGALLAAILTAYAGGVLASALRREQAILRIRGANRRHLLRMHALRTLALAAVGSVLGVALGLVSSAAVLSADALASASPVSLLASALLGAGAGFLATGVALYAAGRRGITRQISDERAQLASRAPLWRLLGIDFLILAAAIGVEWYQRRHGGFEGVQGSVYFGRAVSLQLHLVIVPIGIWLGGVLVLGRIVERGFAFLPLPLRHRFGRPLRGLLTRSIRRRSWAAATAVIMVGLIVALGTSVASFSASYNQAKARDARFVVGSDVRVTPSPISALDHPPQYAEQLKVPGIQTATPVVYGLNNALLESENNEDAGNMAAIDPAAFGQVAPLIDTDFLGTTAANAMDALQRQPGGVLLTEDLADTLDVDVGDSVQVLFARGTQDQKLSELTVIGLFQRLPGFPEGVDVLVNIQRQMQLIPSTNTTFFLAQTTDPSDATLDRVVAGLQEGPGSADALQIDTRATALDKDQSSLAALNIRGLLTLDSAYALAMAATAITIFVFGLLLQRRREYVTLRAQGMRIGKIRSLLVTESSGVVVIGAAVGVLVGAVMAYFLVTVLRPLFVLRPEVVLPRVDIAVLAALVLAVSVVASLAATTLIRRLPPGELLRDE
ncbi:MAG TPA: FtsX-like permease family protein [Propionibacteriaceae bacterium]|jgi:putative ABC transport system permease protein|nr:FtsX-like permease family protein [Propionibacteriaceae bacterium]